MSGKNISIPLDIPGVTVNEVVINPHGPLEIYISSTLEGTPCHRCGEIIYTPHGHDREIKIRHLSILGKPTYLILRPIRYVCKTCQDYPTTTQQLDWYTSCCSVTHAYEDHILRQLVNSTVSDVSQKERVGCDTIEDIMDRCVKEQVDWEEFQALPTIGIDDLALRKGHKNFSTIITVRDDAYEVRVIGILKDRKKETVKNFFLSIPERLRNTVKTVCSDFYEGYTEAAREVFGEDVIITADRFHVAKLYREAVDHGRKDEMRKLKKTLSPEAYEEVKGVMWLLRKDFDVLKEDEKNKLHKVFNLSPILAATYVFSETLSSIFDKPYTKPEAEEMILGWIDVVKDSAVGYFDKFIGTLEEKMDIITNYFVSRSNSGFVEGVNHRIRVLLGRCYGLFDIKHIFQRINLDMGWAGRCSSQLPSG